MNHTFQVKIVDPTGSVAGSFDAFKITDITWELNGWGSATIIVPTRDAAASLLPVLRQSVTNWREIQIWRDGVLIFWGPAIKAEGKADFTTIRCVGLLWYLSRRYFGPNTSQFLDNPSMEGTFGTDWGVADCTATQTGAVRLLGPTSIELVPTGGPGQDAYLAQTFTFVHGGSPGLQITFDVAAWFYLVPADWTGPALNERGLHVHSHQGATIYDERFEKINADTPRGVWTKLATKISVPTGATTDVEVRLYAVDGIHWDATGVKVSSFVGASPAVDLGSILENVADYGFNSGSSGADLEMLIDCAATGVVEERMWLTEDHQNIWQAVQEWPARDLSDFEVVWNAGGTTRTFTSWSPRKGAFRASLPINIDGGGVDEPISWSVDVDLAQSASQVRVIGGAGSGPTREVGLAEDRSDLGDLSLHEVISPPSNVNIGVLQALADAELSSRGRPVRVPSVTVPADPYLAGFELGDSFLLTLDWGWLQGGIIPRVIGKRLDPAADALTLVLNTE